MRTARPTSHAFLFVAIAFSAWSATSTVGQENTKPPSPDHAKNMKAGLAIFKSQVRGTFTEHCLDCHSGRSAKADFDMSTRKKLVASGYLGDSANGSYLLQLIRHEEKPFMPHKKDKLSDEQIAAVAKWIDLGAPYDKPLAENSDAAESSHVTDADREYWAFTPLRQNAVPATKGPTEDWCRTDIDRFIVNKLDEAGIEPNPDAEKRTLIRRAYFDLIGLPPDPLEIKTFLENDDPQAYSQMIDRLLSSKHYGERWARHWLDVARFAESSGFEHDDNRSNAYHYRDFVIKAFNQDLPFDEFIRWQLAGDELAPDNPLAMMATGFLGAGTFPTQITETEFESARYDEIDDMVTNTGIAFLGLTVGCARCHDHKFDPIPARDYYAMAATFASTVRSEVDLVLEPAATPTKVQITADGFPPMKNHADGRGYKHFYDNVYFLNRGDVEQKQGIAKADFLTVLKREQDTEHWQSRPPDDWTRSKFRRAALANWMTDTHHGAGHLAARVIVNRLWHHHFGRGLVATPNNFGMQGERPTHPELLDWIANELITNNWSLKHIHRLIMTSSVYRQNNQADKTRANVDRENLFHWRFQRKRLEAEAIRDSMLALSGQWDTRMFGPGSLDENMRRRSVYFTVKRSKLIPTMMLFDWPEHLVSIGRRPLTTTAPQALLFLNNPNSRSFADGFAQRLSKHVVTKGKDEKDKSVDFAAAIDQAHQYAYGRPATTDEIRSGQKFLTEQTSIHREENTESPQQVALSDYAQAILCGNEFVFIQ